MYHARHPPPHLPDQGGHGCAGPRAGLACSGPQRLHLCLEPRVVRVGLPCRQAAALAFEFRVGHVTAVARLGPLASEFGAHLEDHTWRRMKIHVCRMHACTAHAYIDSTGMYITYRYRIPIQIIGSSYLTWNNSLKIASNAESRAGTALPCPLNGGRASRACATTRWNMYSR